MKITYPKDCGNAPKKITLVNLYEAFAYCDEKYILENTSNEIVWDIIGKKIIRGNNNVISTLNKYRDKGIKEIDIINVITHGNIASVNGNIIFDDKTSYSFCDIYKFTGFGKNAKIKEVSSYVIKTI
jgi:hypothetical protein